MNYSDEEKESIAHLIDMSNLSLIGDGTVIVQNETIATILNLIQKQEEEIKRLKEDVSNMYDEKVVRNILEDECGLSKYEIDEILN